jgi:hypothetical protein
MNAEGRRLRIAACVVGVVFATLAVSCGTDDRIPTAPTSPSNAAASPVTTPSAFGQLTAAGVPDLAMCLRAPSAPCVSFPSVRQPLRIGTTALSAPINLSSAVGGTTVTLAWTAPAGAVISYVIEAGSSSGSANLANFSTGNAATTFSTSGVPAGTYFVRVRVVDASAAAGPASNEVVVVVGGGGCVLPGPPTGVTSTNSGGTVTLSWTAAAGSPTSYILEAGSAPGLANLANADVGGGTTFTATGVAAGSYYVRVRGRNACGIGAVSIEVTIVVTVPAPSGRGSMSATIDGTRWNAVVIIQAAIQGGVLRVGGQDSMTAPFLALGVAVPPAVGTYTVSAATGATVAGSLAQVGVDVPLLQWNANFTAGSGTVTLTTLTATGASGTFSFNLVHIVTASTGTRVITDGVFNVNF